jgi:hypothetical protein
MKSKKTNLLLLIFIVAAAVLTRLLPHAWNFAPVTAVAIAAGAYLPKKQAVLLTLVIRFISDCIIGFFAWPMMVAVYAAHLFGVVAGVWLSEKKSFGRLLMAPVFSALVFFLVTNFAFLYTFYPHDISGIIAAYANGLPFLRGTLLGDLVYTFALVGGFEAAIYLQKFKMQKPACLRPLAAVGLKLKHSTKAKLFS